ncbi:uncharacterized protein METZ01_LOCUS465658, partial [marine metagenome]
GRRFVHGRRGPSLPSDGGIFLCPASGLALWAQSFHTGQLHRRSFRRVL